jgi:hypothetical protein
MYYKSHTLSFNHPDTISWCNAKGAVVIHYICSLRLLFCINSEADSGYSTTFTNCANVSSLLEFCHASGFPWIIIMDTGLDDSVYWQLLQSTRTYKQYIAIYLQFIVTHSRGFLGFTSQILVMENSLIVTKSSTPSLSLHRPTSNSSSATDFPWLFLILCCNPLYFHSLVLDSILPISFLYLRCIP